MNISKGKRANILPLGTYAAVGDGIDLKKARFTFIPITIPHCGTARYGVLIRWLQSDSSPFIRVLNPPHESKKVRIGMSLLRFFAGRVVEIPRMECFGISGLRILPTVAFLYRCTSLYIGRGQVLFQNLLLIIAPSIRGRSEGCFAFEFFAIATFLSKVIDSISDERQKTFCTQVHRKNPQPDDVLLYVDPVIFFIRALFACFGNDLYALFCGIVKVRDFYVCTVFQNVNGILSIVTGCRDELILKMQQLNKM